MQEKNISLHRKKPSAEFRRPQTAKKRLNFQNSGDMCLGILPFSLQTCGQSGGPTATQRSGRGWERRSSG